MKGQSKIRRTFLAWHSQLHFREPQPGFQVILQSLNLRELNCSWPLVSAGTRSREQPDMRLSPDHLPGNFSNVATAKACSPSRSGILSPRCSDPGHVDLVYPSGRASFPIMSSPPWTSSHPRLLHFSHLDPPPPFFSKVVYPSFTRPFDVHFHQPRNGASGLPITVSKPLRATSIVRPFTTVHATHLQQPLQ